MNAEQSYHILVMGAAGAGSSTLGKNLAKTQQWPHFESDEYYWLPTDPPFTAKRPLEERVSLLQSDLIQQQNWVVSGVLCNWGHFIIPMLSHVIFVYADWDTRLKRIKHREQQLHGTRILPGGDMYEHHQAFLDWASQYDTEKPISRTKKKHLDWLSTLTCEVIEVDTSKAVDVLVKQLLQRIL